MARPIVFLIFLSFCLIPVVHAQPAAEQLEDGQWGTPVSDPLDALYGEAMELYKQHRYVEAREKFLQLQAISPEAYPSSKVFLKRIDQHITQQEADLKIEQERQEVLRRKKEEQLEASQKAQLNEIHRSYQQEKMDREQKNKQEALKQQQAARDLVRRGEDRYKNILALYKAGRLTEAKDQIELLKKFLVKYDVSQDFRIRMTQKTQKAEKLIAARERQQQADAARAEQRKEQNAQKRLAAERKITEARQIAEKKKKDQELLQKVKLQSQKKVKQMQEDEATLAKKEKFAALLAASHKSEVQNKIPASRPAPSAPPVPPAPPAEKMAKVPVPDEVDRAQRQELKNKLMQEVDTLYHEGIDLYRSRQWSVAKNVFSQLDRLLPNYKSTRSYLAAIDQNLESSENQAKSREDIIKEALDAQVHQ